MASLWPLVLQNPYVRTNLSVSSRIAGRLCGTNGPPLPVPFGRDIKKVAGDESVVSLF